jgi:ectoine hydroxylase-related dioxygenase (phytanoyl-CoA dioxygenase family)
VFSVRPGAKSQELHRDDIVHHTYHPAAAAHELGRDSGLSMFVAGKRSTRQNGATRFVPGSHLWDYSAPPPPTGDDSSAFYAELAPGDAFIMLSGCYHGASANTTASDERLLYATFTTRGYLRQEENQYLACDAATIKRLPIDLQRFVGYSVSAPYLGCLEVDDPMRVINPDAESLGDLF